MLAVEIGRTTRAFGCDPWAGPSVQDLVAQAVLGTPPRGEIAIVDSLSLKWALADQAPITIRDLFELVPIDDTLVTFSVTGAELALLCRSMATGRRLPFHVAGARLIVDSGEVRLLIGDTPVDPNATLSVVTSDRLIAGGRGFQAMSRFHRVAQPLGVGVRQALDAWIRQVTPLGPEDLPPRPSVVTGQPVDRTGEGLRRFDRLKKGSPSPR